MAEQIADQMPPAEYITDAYRAAGKLDGKRVLITGGDSGIGRAVAYHMAREGAKVAILYHSDEDGAEETRKGIEAEGAEAMVLQGNTGSSDDCRAAVEAVASAWGGIDVLVNNAGMQATFDTLDDVSDDDWDLHFSVNMAGMFYTSRAALKHMGEGGAIVNSGSINAFTGNADLLPYTATKGSISAFTRALALQLMSRGIRVNQVAPGPVITPIQKVFDEDELKDMAAPMGRMGQPSEIAPAYVYLASRDSSFVTGQTLHVNGGMIVGA